MTDVQGEKAPGPKTRLPEGESLPRCAQCEAVISEARYSAVPGLRLCVACQAEIEKERTTLALYNAHPYNRELLSGKLDEAVSMGFIIINRVRLSSGNL